MGIRFFSLNNTNAREIFNLKVLKDQESFVASNVRATADAFVVSQNGKWVKCFGICDKDIPVGYACIGYDINYPIDLPDIAKDNYTLWRIMIDHRFQKRGYGRKSYEKIINFMKAKPYKDAEYIFALCNPQNNASWNLFKSFGFEREEELYYGEMVIKLKI